MKQIRKDRKRRRVVDGARSSERMRKAGLMDERRVRVLGQESAYLVSKEGNLRQKKEELMGRASVAERVEAVAAGKGGYSWSKVTKVRNRCVETGRGRSVIRWFRRSGRTVREIGRKGRLEGVYRVSW